MTDEKRPYRKTRRAELEDGTRRRITESAVALHGELGPARTTISAIAEHAGVRRSTVYRHFPDEAALIGACSAHWSAANPAPDLERWGRIADPDERVAEGLRELYAFYGRGERMLENVLRDEATSPATARAFAGFRQYLGAAREVLTADRAAADDDGATRAAIGHALAFHTWRSLARDEGLGDARAAELMGVLITSAAA